MVLSGYSGAASSGAQHGLRDRREARQDSYDAPLVLAVLSSLKGKAGGVFQAGLCDLFELFGDDEDADRAGSAVIVAQDAMGLIDGVIVAGFFGFAGLVCDEQNFED